MQDFPILWEWLEFAARWLHVITAIAWIGSSFYFIALDLGLKRPARAKEGVIGEAWQVHGGGFYHIQKYGVAPDDLPSELTWFKWESYATWLSGFALLCIVYYAGADLHLIDPRVLDLSRGAAIALSAASLACGWLLYDRMCASRLGEDEARLTIALFGVLIVLCWGFLQVFSAKAAFLHLGALTATIMSGNVFFVIIPNQKIVVADLEAGRTPDPKYGKIAKTRSTHNNYLTLPVIFFMLSNHYPLAFGTQFSWLIAVLVFTMGVTIRHYFNVLHRGGRAPIESLLIAALTFVAIAWLSTQPASLGGEDAPPSRTALETRLAQSPHFEAARAAVLGRCSMCHAEEPFHEGVWAPPAGVVLDHDEAILAQARSIYLQAARSDAMPPGNRTFMAEEERASIRAWYEEAIDGS